jgi:RHS repeat-associated protein
MRETWCHKSGPIMLIAFAVLVVALSAAVGFRSSAARADESRIGPEVLGATAEQTKRALESAGVGQSPEPADTDLEAAHQLPHRRLGREEALELAEGVFSLQLEEPAGIYGDFEAKEFLSDYAALVPSSTLAEMPGAEGAREESELPPEGSVLLESSLPLRVENEEGEAEAVNLSLQSAEESGGALQPVNPLVEVEAPAHLGEGVTLPGLEVGIKVAGAPEDQTPSNVEGSYAFYPNVAEDTDLAVAPTSTGVDVMTDIRSADAPLATTYELSLPEGADLRSDQQGDAEVVQGGHTTALVPPPSATDAAGEPVAVSQRVEGNELTVTVSPTASTQFPILVDPEFIEIWHWTYLHESQAAWTPTTNEPAFQPFSFAVWETENPHPAPGLDLSSGVFGNSKYGGQAQWLYTVPRYAADVSGYGTPPSTWIYQLTTENVWFRTYGNSGNYPAMIIGLADPGTGGWWTEHNQVWYGGQGDLSGVAIWPTLNFGDEATKAADFAYVTYENEYPAKRRDAYIGGAAVAVVDKASPSAPILTAPTGWLSGSAAKFIQYTAEDTGLGIRAASVRVAGEEEALHPFWKAYLECWGTVASPCPRKAVSGEAKVPSAPVVPAEMPTGRDIVEVSVFDPLGHVATENVAVFVDNTAPEISLSGPLTEQEKLGTTQTEYPLAISITDGFEDDPPQSGVASVEVKVDGKKITMPNETPWHPACSTRDCAFNGSWTLKASEYAPGDHEVEVIATDAVGHTSREILEVELGLAPPQTSFTSPHPTYEEHDVETISFKATRAGVPVEGATFKCSLDEKPSKTCTSPYPMGHLEPKEWHTLLVTSESGGVADPTPATWKFQTGVYPKAPLDEKLLYPEIGKKTASYYTLEAQWGESPEGKASQGVTGVSFQLKLPGSETFETVPTECTVDGQGRQVSWPLPARSHPGHSAPVYLKVRGCPSFEKAGYPEMEVQFRAVFDGSEKVAGASEPTATEFVSRYNANRVSTDATESVGPATLDLLTGAFTLSRTDVSIPVPGYEANLEFTRTYSSAIDKSLSKYSKVLGGAWQPASPLESEYEGEAWTRIEEKYIPEKPEKWGHACWTEKVVEENEEEVVTYPEVQCPENVGKNNCPPEWCEEWLEEPAQPAQNWIELIDNEGAGIPFEIAGNSLIAPEYAKELVLREEGENIVLAYPNGTHTTFARQEGGTKHSYVWLPKFISYQANSQSMRMKYEPEPQSKAVLLVEEVSPTPVGSSEPCEEGETARKAKGCRSLDFNYETMTLAPGQTTKVLKSITYYGPDGSGAGQVVAQYEYGVVQLENGELAAALISEKDPRLPASVPAEKYAYANPSRGNLLTSLTPPGQEPWSFEYVFVHPNDLPDVAWLKSVGRAGTKSTIAYEVPVKGFGAPYDLSSESIAKWGETDVPVDATAIFPPNHAPAEYPPQEYTGATIHYMDPEGYEVNTAAPSPPGVSGQSISTSETDVHGNVVRALSAQNRLLALGSPGPATRSHELDTHAVFSPNGNEQLESWGPLHPVRLASGEAVEARRHTVTRYDEEEPKPPLGTPWAYLPTKETVSAVVPGKEGELEPRVTVTKYDWKLRKPIETIVDPEGLNIRSITKYNTAGQVTETRQPKAAGGNSAGDTQTIYWSAGGYGECEGRPALANLPCRVLPAAQAEGTNRPKLLWKTYQTYNNLGEPLVVYEGPPSEPMARKTTTEYDEAGRQKTQKIEGGGAKVPKTETLYSASTGMPVTQQFVCESQCGPAGSFQSALAGAGGNQFNHPADVAFDSKGNIWVLDKGNNRVEEFNEKGEFVRAAGSEGSTGGKLKYPSAIAVDPSNNVWVADAPNNRVEEFNEKGEFVAALGKDVNKTKVEAKGTEAERNYCSAASGNVCQAGPEGTAPGQLKAPQGIAVTTSGNIWVADTGHSRMEKYSPTGGLLNNSFAEGSALGQVKEPTAVAMGPGGSLWVADTGNNRIEHWDSTLSNPAVFGTLGSEDGKFNRPDALEVLANGKVWVGDEWNSRFEEFTESGGFIGKFGTAGSGAGQFSFSVPIGIAVDSKGNIWVTDPGHNKVQKWAPTEATDTQATTVEYNALGQPKKYEDADGNVAETTYDAYGRPVTTSDKKGSQTITYDPVSGVVTKLEDSAAGTFTATYNADGSLIERGLPDGLTAKTTYNAAGEPTALSYTKATFCGESCTWLTENLERSISGQIVNDNGTLVNDSYSYDKAGRLTEARETPANGSCATRAYTYDADSNRLSKATRPPGVGGVCVTTGGEEQKYTYDAADRLEGPTYDAFGRITSLPSQYAGGQALTTSYYNTNMVASQTQGAITNSYELDAGGRQRSRLQGGGLEGTEIFHYDGGSDSPAWTERNGTWSRNITGIGGELAAVQDSSAGTSLRLTDLHGDVVAVAELSPAATKLKETFRFDEFGNPMSASAGRFGWLGGKQRRTELASGVIQMGARSYVPSLGRFLTPDPIRGGSANPYDYANQDPVNAFDLGGTCSKKNTKNCLAVIRKQRTVVRRKVARAERAVHKYEHELGHMHRSFNEPRHPLAFGIPSFFEKDFGEFLEYAGKALFNNYTPCSAAAAAAGAGSMAGNAAADAAQSTPEGAEVAGIVRSASSAVGNFGIVLGIAAGAGEC